VKALVFERSLTRFAAAKAAGMLRPGGGARVGPLALDDIDEPALPSEGWVRVRPRLSGICGSDLATVDGTSSRYFEPIVSFPFVPGHEVVGELEDGSRVVLEPVLGCATRGVTPPCAPCLGGDTGRCERVAFGHLEPGLQTGFCTDTGGGWSLGLVAHESQIHRVPDDLTDEAAVLIEPAACAIHGARRAHVRGGDTVVVLGAGTLGLLSIAALRQHTEPGLLIAAAKHPAQRRLATDLGADVVVEPSDLRRAVRRHTGAFEIGRVLAGGADRVVDCVGSAESIAEALAVTRAGGRVTLIGMPARVNIDLTPLWHKEVELAGAYAYGQEGDARTFDLAIELAATLDLGRLVSAHYRLEHYREALEHAANAGRRGAVKIVFDMRGEKRQ
jgi:threonine dehydrogenase-like Zn-dependent dehydrogenase